MNTYNPTSWKKKLVFAVATIAVVAGTLELVAGGMKNPGQEAMASRQQVITAEADRAAQIRSVEKGELKFADVPSPTAR